MHKKIKLFGNNRSPIDAGTLQAILDETLSQRLAQMGLMKSTSYCWHEQTVKEIRRGFSYAPLKGKQGTFTWGINLDFLPIVSNGKIIYHKSAKKYLHHLFEWTDEYAGSFTGGKLAGGVTTHWGLWEARKSIRLLFDRYEGNIITWFDKANTLENLIDIAEKQASIGKSYIIHSPGVNYVLAFLFARTNQVDLAIRQFDSLNDYEFENQDIREKLRVQLIKLPEKQV